MRFNRSVALALTMSIGTALFVWSHAQAKAHKTGSAARIQPVRSENTSLVLPGTVFPVITTPLSGRNLELTVPLNTWVKRGQVIGIAESLADPGERDHAWQVVAEATFAEQRAQDEIRQDQEELCTLQSQVGGIDREEARAQVAEADSDREFERQDALFRSGLTSRFDYNAAATARDFNQSAISSIRSSLAESAIAIDQWQAKAQQAEIALREATTRRNAAEAIFDQMQRGPIHQPVVSPADGFIVASGEAVAPGVGIASGPWQVCAYVRVRQADLMAVSVGQQARIVLDAHSEVILAGKVSDISETSLDLPEGAAYEVAVVADNPAGTWLSGSAVHVHIARASR